MGKKRRTAESIVAMLREAEVQMAKGQRLAEVVRQLGISDATYYKWRKEYGGLHVDQAKRYKDGEQFNLTGSLTYRWHNNRGQVNLFYKILKNEPMISKRGDVIKELKEEYFIVCRGIIFERFQFI